jgi:beta-glucanase (GH16 family)
MLPTPPAGYKWQLAPSLSDEFNGNALDKKKWLPYQPYWKGREPSQFDSANASEHGGRLLLKSTTDRDSLAGIADPNKDIWISAACVTSTTARASYGYYEARMKASGLTMTSSFWLQGKYSEIDVVEEIGKPVERPNEASLMMSNTHYFAGGWANDKSTQTWRPMATSPAGDYHIYGVWWKDDRTVIFYDNGKEMAQVTTGGLFDEPMYLFFDTEAFALWEGLPTIVDLKDPAKNTMSVDWVRSWKLVPVK